MRPLSLSIEGFRSFRGKQTIDFSGLELFAVIGDTGAGKSSILEAIVYALYNKSTWNETNVKALIALDADTMRVDLRFAVGTRTFEVTRSASRSPGRPSLHALRSPDDASLRVDNERPVNAEIERITGLSYKTFVSTVVLPQGQFAELLTVSDGVRTRILSELLGLDEIDRIREAIEPAFERSRAAALTWRGRLDALGPDPVAEATRMRERRDDALAASTRLQTTRVGVNELSQRLGGIVARVERARQTRDALAGTTAAVKIIAGLRVCAEEVERDREHARESASRAQATFGDAESAEAALRERQLDEASVAQAVSRFEVSLRDREQLVSKQNQRDDEAIVLSELEASVAASMALRVAAEAQCAAARTARDEADRSVRTLRAAENGARDAWRDLVAARANATRGAENASAAAQALESARSRAAEAKSVFRDGTAAVQSAESELERGRRMHAVADAAIGLCSGQPCPICGATLAEGFSPPPEPKFEEAKQRAAEAKRRRETAARNLATMDERAVAAFDHFTAASAEAKRASDAATAASRQAVQIGIDPGAPSESHALMTVASALTVAEESATEGGRELSMHEKSLAGLQVRCKSDTDRLTSDKLRYKALVAEIVRIERELATAAATIPEALRPHDTFESALVAGLSSAREALEAAHATHERLKVAHAEYSEAQHACARADARFEREVNAPIQAGIARAEASLVRLDDDPLQCERAPVPARSKETDVFDWAASLSEWCIAEDGVFAQMMLEAEHEGVDLRKNIGSMLAEHGLSSVDDLGDAVQAAASACAVLAAQLDSAERAASDAALARERLEAILPLEHALDRLRRYLQNNEFKEYLMRRRERTLLGCATEVLRAMTGGMYAFAEGFAILDGFTQQTRDARTLSGGEKFLASLALALGLVEIASLAGGRLDALFLDEGFGSLDAAALDAALAELSERARGGKMIGMITHVGAVADAIDTVLRVRRLPGGSTVTRLVGVERDEFLGGGGSGLLGEAG